MAIKVFGGKCDEIEQLIIAVEFKLLGLNK